MKRDQRLYLSPPHMGGGELENIKNAFASNWIAPVGPDLNKFEEMVCQYTGGRYAVALASGTAALHLALMVAGVRSGDDVYCSTFTFAGSAFPIRYLQATPVFIDSEINSWNMDPQLLQDALQQRVGLGHRPGAVIAVHLYGNSANMNAIKAVCDDYGVVLIEDAAESLGAYCGNVPTGTIGDYAVLSFNGNKIITTSGGGMLIGKENAKIDTVRFLSTQARDAYPHYEHSSIGYNYRMSNIVAAIGCGQMKVLEERVARKREIYRSYQSQFSNSDEISMMPIDTFGRSNCWLTCINFKNGCKKNKTEKIRRVLEHENIESRPLWKPMHLQPIFKNAPVFKNGVSETLFGNGLCLPSGTAMKTEDIELVVSTVLNHI